MAVATTEFSSHETDIPGLLIFDVTKISDERGSFQEKYQKAKLVAAGMNSLFNLVQLSVSYNEKAGAIRGFHAEPWDKYISVVTGRVFAAYVDLRDGPTFGKVVTTEIDTNKTVFLPQGVANSFQTLEPECNYAYGVNDHWSADNYDKYCFVNLADPDLSVKWPIPLSEATMSDRDKTHSMLRDIKPMKI